LACGEVLLLLGLFELVWRRAARKLAPQLFARHPSLIAEPKDAARSPDALQHSI